MNRINIEPNYKNLKRSVALVNDIYTSLRQAETYKSFATGTAKKNDAIHRIRLFHDQFLLDAHKNRCIGTVYRSKGVIDNNIKVVGLEAQDTSVHCEHVIPASIIGRYIYERMNKVNLFELGQFLYRHQLVCCITKEEQKSNLGMSRPYAGKTKKWSKDHPNFELDDGFKIIDSNQQPIDFSDVLLFARYRNTGIDVFNILNDEQINFETYTIRDHVNMMIEHAYPVAINYDQALKEFSGKTPNL